MKKSNKISLSIFLALSLQKKLQMCSFLSHLQATIAISIKSSFLHKKILPFEWVFTFLSSVHGHYFNIFYILLLWKLQCNVEMRITTAFLEKNKWACLKECKTRYKIKCGCFSQCSEEKKRDDNVLIRFSISICHVNEDHEK